MRAIFHPALKNEFSDSEHEKCKRLNGHGWRGAAYPQKITAVAMNASENTAVGEHKSTVPNVSLWYA